MDRALYVIHNNINLIIISIVVFSFVFHYFLYKNIIKKFNIEQESLNEYRYKLKLEKESVNYAQQKVDADLLEVKRIYQINQQTNKMLEKKKAEYSVYD